MAMNRRNVLVGLGAVAVGGGAAFGSGAFSQVSAARTVTVDTAGDSAAFLGIQVDGTYAVDGESTDESVQIDLGDSSSTGGFNDDAVTTVNGILTLANNTADNSSITVGFDNGSGGQTASTVVVIETDGSSNVVAEAEFTLSQDDGNGNEYTLPDDTSTVDVNVTVRTGTETTASSTTADKAQGSLTLIAN